MNYIPIVSKIRIILSTKAKKAWIIEDRSCRAIRDSRWEKDDAVSPYCSGWVLDYFYKPVFP